MALVSMNWQPNDRQLRQFSIGALIALPVLGWLWAGSNAGVLAWAAGFGIALAILGWLRPRCLAPLFIGVSLLTIPIGWIISELVLLSIFVCVIWPIGFFRRRIIGDPLQRQFEPDARTYWQPRSQPKDVTSYFRQF